MTLIDVPVKFLIFYFLFLFFWGSGSLNPTELRGVKRAGHSQFTVAVSALLYPQVHELLIRCCVSTKDFHSLHFFGE
jgi:hypothetical protein